LQLNENRGELSTVSFWKPVGSFHFSFDDLFNDTRFIFKRDVDIRAGGESLRRQPFTTMYAFPNVENEYMTSTRWALTESSRQRLT